MYLSVDFLLIQSDDQVKSLLLAFANANANANSHRPSLHPDHPNLSTINEKDQDTYIDVTPMMCICGIAIVTYIVSVIIREVVQIHQQKWQYLLEPNNFISWILCISAGITVSPVFTNGYINDLHFTASSITVFLSWFNLLLFLQRFDQVEQIRKKTWKIITEFPSFFYFSSMLDRYLCGDVFGNLTNFDQSIVCLFHIDHCIWIGILHSNV